LTFPAYLENAAAKFKAKGATVIISSQTPNNPDEGGSFVYSPSRFVGYAELAAEAADTDYIDHGQYVANYFQTQSVSTVDSFFPNDHTHTSPLGADHVARAFVKGVACSGISLASYVKNSTSSIEGSCI
jgi:rhamnogalacturonan acetylesterase